MSLTGDPGKDTGPNRREGIRVGLALGLTLATGSTARAAPQEAPFFKADVAGGKLPAVQARVPQEPAVAELESIGAPGGELRMLMGSAKDTRMMVVYGYARLVGYTPALSFAPDILKSIEI